MCVSQELLKVQQIRISCLYQEVERPLQIIYTLYATDALDPTLKITTLNIKNILKDKKSQTIQ